MKHGRKRHFVIALALLATLGVTAAGYTHGRGRPWWLKPPAPEIEPVTFSSGETDHGSVKTAVVTEGELVSSSRVALVDDDFVAAVDADGQLTFEEIALASEDGSTTAIVTLEAATLRRNFLNSTFTGEGTAVVSTTTTVIDPATGEEMEVTTTTEIDVVVFGLISVKHGEYKLRAHVRGLDIADDEAGTTTYTLFKVELEAEAEPVSEPS
jgi:hypothetical protein